MAADELGVKVKISVRLLYCRFKSAMAGIRRRIPLHARGGKITPPRVARVRWVARKLSDAPRVLSQSASPTGVSDNWNARACKVSCSQSAQTTPLILLYVAYLSLAVFFFLFFFFGESYWMCCNGRHSSAECDGRRTRARPWSRRDTLQVRIVLDGGQHWFSSAPLKAKAFGSVERAFPSVRAREPVLCVCRESEEKERIHTRWQWWR